MQILMNSTNLLPYKFHPPYIAVIANHTHKLISNPTPDQSWLNPNWTYPISYNEASSLWSQKGGTSCSLYKKVTCVNINL